MPIPKIKVTSEKTGSKKGPWKARDIKVNIQGKNKTTDISLHKQKNRYDHSSPGKTKILSVSSTDKKTGENKALKVKQKTYGSVKSTTISKDKNGQHSANSRVKETDRKRVVSDSGNQPPKYVSFGTTVSNKKYKNDEVISDKKRKAIIPVKNRRNRESLY